MRITTPSISPKRAFVLGSFALAVIVTIPWGQLVPGAILLGISYLAARRTGDSTLLRRMAVLYVVVLVLGLVDINTGLTNRNFLRLGLAFLVAVLFPTLVMKGTDPSLIAYRFVPKYFRKREVFYVLISAPTAWVLIRIYFTLNPWMPSHWELPAAQDGESLWRLFCGINLVGIWDELFFVNIVFTVLRSLFPYRWANAGQAVVYTSVLYDMAFTGLGILIVPVFAWMQGSMFESSKGLLGVLLVHLIVDFFLLVAIAQYHYPGITFGWH